AMLEWQGDGLGDESNFLVKEKDQALK
ncbi:MAG: hypothetical protein JWN83_258, partial [Chitinophagaceae bacterium]|nr:hypothetical protein [Chitinophagaceae bacterium]